MLLHGLKSADALEGLNRVEEEAVWMGPLCGERKRERSKGF